MHGVHVVKVFQPEEYMLFAEAVINHMAKSKSLKVTDVDTDVKLKGAYKYHLAKNVALSAIHDVKKWLKQKKSSILSKKDGKISRTDK